MEKKFELTTEEVEIVEDALSCLLNESGFDEESDKKTYNLLTRIKQWKDENNRTD